MHDIGVLGFIGKGCPVYIILKPLSNCALCHGLEKTQPVSDCVMAVCRCLELTRNNKKYTLIAWITGALFSAITDDKCPAECPCPIRVSMPCKYMESLTSDFKQLHLAIMMLVLPEDVGSVYLAKSIPTDGQEE